MTRRTILLLLASVGFGCASAALPAAEPAPQAAPARNWAAEISQARRVWDADSREIAELLAKLRRAVDTVTKAQADLVPERKELAKLEADKRRALEELREGAFCTGCGQTRSQILASGSSFPHPGERVRPATPEELAKAEKDFNERIARVRARIKTLEDTESDAKRDLDAAHHAFLVRVDQYHRHIIAERDLRVHQWADEQTVAETRIKALQDSFAAASKALNAAPPPADAERATAASLQRQLNERFAAASSAEGRAEQDERAFVRYVTNDFERLGRIAANLPDRFGIGGGPFIAARIRSIPIAPHYVVAPINRSMPAPGSALNSLLTSPPKKSGPEKPAAEKSVRDLLDGK